MLDVYSVIINCHNWPIIIVCRSNLLSRHVSYVIGRLTGRCILFINNNCAEFPQGRPTSLSLGSL